MNKDQRERFRETICGFRFFAVIAMSLSLCAVGCSASFYLAPGNPSSISYTVGGTVTGLAPGNTVSLLNKGGDSVKVTANGAFTFSSPVAENGSYAVSVGTMPLWQSCTVSRGSGTVTTANVTNVAVSCVTAATQVGIFAGTPGVTGSANGPGSTALFNSPLGLAIDTAGNIYVADLGNNEIRKVTAAGVVTTLAGSPTVGSADGTGSAASFNSPAGVAVDGAGNVYVADSGNSEIRKITPAGVVTTLAGSTHPGTADGTGSAASFQLPMGIAVDQGGNVYVSDVVSQSIRKITPAGVVTTLAGSGSTASFTFPAGITVDAEGNLYITDVGNNNVSRMTPAGVVTTLAGSAGTSGETNGTGSAASFNGPLGIGLDAVNNLYVADYSNNAIRKVTQGGVVTTLVSSLAAPAGIVLDPAGNLYISEAGNNTIQKITPVQ